MGEKKMKGGVIAATVIIIVCVLFTIGNFIAAGTNKKTEKEHKNKGIPVVATIVSRGLITDVISQAGSIQSRSSVDVYARIPGKIIRKILVETGMHVKKGQPLAHLENNAVLARLAEAEAELEAAEAGFKAASANLDVIEKDKARHENLFAEKAVAARQVDLVTAQFKSAFENRHAAMAKTDKAKAAIKQLKIAIEDHTIEAPISGIVTKRFVDPGTMSSLSLPVARISEETGLRIVTAVTQKDLPGIKKAMKAFVKVDAFPERKFEGRIDIVSGEIRPDNRMSEIEVNLDNADLSLKPGMFAEITIITGQRQGTLVPRDALLRLPGTGSFYVFAVENDRAVQKNVTIGIQEADRVEILSGIKSGETVVIQGHNRLRDGDPVKTEEKTRGAA